MGMPRPHHDIFVCGTCPIHHRAKNITRLCSAIKTPKSSCMIALTVIVVNSSSRIYIALPSTSSTHRHNGDDADVGGGDDARDDDDGVHGCCLRISSALFACSPKTTSSYGSGRRSHRLLSPEVRGQTDAGSPGACPRLARPLGKCHAATREACDRPDHRRDEIACRDLQRARR